ncbi:MAG: hypothetical protein ACE5KA_04315 [Nitrososphaerales archaeon]
MKETAKVDQSIVDKLEGLANVFTEYQEKWLTSRNTKVAIYFYYAARNAALVVSRIRERFLSSKGTNENPKIAEESLQVVGLIGELLDLTQNEKPDEGTTKLIIERVGELRKVATKTKLVETQEKELEDIDKLLTYLSKLRR